MEEQRRKLRRRGWLQSDVEWKRKSKNGKERRETIRIKENVERKRITYERGLGAVYREK